MPLLGSLEAGQGSVELADGSTNQGGGGNVPVPIGPITSGDQLLLSGDSIVLGYDELKLSAPQDNARGCFVPLVNYITSLYGQRGLTAPTFQNTAVIGQTSTAWLADLTAQVLTPVAGGVVGVFLVIGANDVDAAIPPATTAANIVSAINQSRAINPNVFWHVVLNPFVHSEDPAFAENLSMAATNAAISTAVRTLSGVVVHDWPTIAYEWEARNNVPSITQGLLVQTNSQTHPSPTGQIVCSDAVWANLGFTDITSPPKLFTLGTVVPFNGTTWFQRAANIAQHFAKFTGSFHHRPLRYSDISAAAPTSGTQIVPNDGNVEGGGIVAAGVRWFVNATEFQTPTTTAWGIFFRANLSLQAAASSAEVGLLSPIGGPTLVRVRNDVGLGANAFLQTFVGGVQKDSVDTGFALAAGYHDIGLFFTGAAPAGTFPADTLFCVIDGEDFVSLPATNLPPTPAAYGQNTGTMKCLCSEFATFWLAP